MLKYPTPIAIQSFLELNEVAKYTTGRGIMT
jgi:hypothetical protein